jgi:hypothetical protein
MAFVRIAGMIFLSRDWKFGRMLRGALNVKIWKIKREIGGNESGILINNLRNDEEIE